MGGGRGAGGRRPPNQTKTLTFSLDMVLSCYGFVLLWFCLVMVLSCYGFVLLWFCLVMVLS
jgi:hypothetical protein